MNLSRLNPSQLSFGELLYTIRKNPSIKPLYRHEIMGRIDGWLQDYEITAKQERNHLIEWILSSSECMVLPEKKVLMKPGRLVGKILMVVEGGVDVYVNDPAITGFVGAGVAGVDSIQLEKVDSIEKVSSDEIFTEGFEKNVAPRIEVSKENQLKKRKGEVDGDFFQEFCDVLNTNRELTKETKDFSKKYFKLMRLGKGDILGTSQILFGKLNDFYYSTSIRTCLLVLPKEIFNESFKKYSNGKLSSQRDDLVSASNLKNPRFIEWIRPFAIKKVFTSGTVLLKPKMRCLEIYFLKCGIIDITVDLEEEGKHLVISSMKDTSMLNVCDFNPIKKVKGEERDYSQSNFKSSIFKFTVKTDGAILYAIPVSLFDYALDLFPDVVEVIEKMKSVRNDYYNDRITHLTKIKNRSDSNSKEDGFSSFRREGKIFDLIRKKKERFNDMNLKINKEKRSQELREQNTFEIFKRQKYLDQLKENMIQRNKEKLLSKGNLTGSFQEKDKESLSRRGDEIADIEDFIRNSSVIIRRVASNSMVNSNKTNDELSLRCQRLRSANSSSEIGLVKDIKIKTIGFLSRSRSGKAVSKESQDATLKDKLEGIFEPSPLISLSKNKIRLIHEANSKRSQSIESAEMDFESTRGVHRAVVKERNVSRNRNSPDLTKSIILGKEITTERGGKTIAGFAFDKNARRRLRTVGNVSHGHKASVNSVLKSSEQSLRIDTQEQQESLIEKVKIRIVSAQQDKLQKKNMENFKKTYLHIRKSSKVQRPITALKEERMNTIDYSNMNETLAGQGRRLPTDSTVKSMYLRPHTSDDDREKRIEQGRDQEQ